MGYDNLDPEDLKPFRGSLVQFSGEQVHVNGYITLWITFGKKDQDKDVNVIYLVINSPSSYNMIIGQPTFNRLHTILSTLYLCIKYLLPNRRVRVIQGGRQKMLRRKPQVEENPHSRRDGQKDRLGTKAT